MFRKLWQALAGLVNSIRDLTSTFQEADVMAREKFGLPPRSDNNDNQEQLEHKEDEPLKLRQRNVP